MSPFFFIFFDIIFLFAAELEEPKIGMSGKKEKNAGFEYTKELVT